MTTGDAQSHTRATPTSQYAIIVIPGIMGSRLVDTATDDVLWGGEVGTYLRLWAGDGLGRLALTDDERNGIYGRIRADGMLRLPAFAPLLRGLEPYTRLISAIRRLVVDLSAVREFAYDWRLPVAHNAGLLAEAAQRHLAAWRARSGNPDAGLAVIAHSMGGLLARHLATIPGASDGIQTTITLGTPFYGSVKAAVILNAGQGAPVPLPRKRLRDLAATLPAMHDLLPTFRCVDEGTTARRLTPDDVADLGGDPDLAQASGAWVDHVSGVTPPGHVQVVGVRQPTWQSIVVDGGAVRPQRLTCRPADGGGMVRDDLAGDGTVHAESARLPASPRPMPLGQSHGALAKTEEALLIITDALLDQRTGPWQGAGEIGLDLPDVVAAGEATQVTVTGVEHPLSAGLRVVDVATRQQIARPPLERRDGAIAAVLSLPKPGLFRVEATGGGFSAVTELVLAADLDADR
jgi:hypothetical protein